MCCNNEDSLGVAKGDKGDQGYSGTNGANGVNAFTATTVDYIQPPVDTTVVITVANGSWVSVGQTIFIVGGGYYVVAGQSNTTITVSYGSEYATTNQTLALVGDTVNSGAKITPAGIKGDTGTPGSNVLTAYGYYYINSDSASSIASLGKVLWDTTLNSAGLTLSAPGQITILSGNSGKYKIIFTVAPVQIGKFSIYINEVKMEAGTYACAANGQITGHAIFTLSVADIISVRNTTNGTINLQSIDSEQIVGSIALEKIAEL